MSNDLFFMRMKSTIKRQKLNICKIILSQTLLIRILVEILLLSYSMLLNGLSYSKILEPGKT